MATEPFDDALARTGADPSPAFAAALEARLLADHDRGHVAGAPGSNHARVVAVGLAAALTAATVIAIVVLPRDEHGRVVTVPSSSTPLPSSVTTTTAPTPTTPTTLPVVVPPPTTLRIVPPSTAPRTSSATLPTTSPGPVTTPGASPWWPVLTIPPPSTVTASTVSTHPVVQVRLGDPAPDLEPILVASRPRPDPDELGAWAAPASGNRIFVFNAAGEIEILSATNGTRLGSARIRPATPQTATIGTWVGPDDIVYRQEYYNGFREGWLIAYAADTSGTYREVARVSNYITDMGFGQYADGLGHPQLYVKYVGTDGHPSGATLDHVRGFDEVASSDLPHLDLRFPTAAQQEECPMCDDYVSGPRWSYVATVGFATAAGEWARRTIVVTSRGVDVYDTDWQPVGALDDRILFVRYNTYSVDIAVVPVEHEVER